MKLIDSNEQYMFECCQYAIKVDNGAATLSKNKASWSWLWLSPYSSPRRIEAKYCPECGTKIPKLKEEKGESINEASQGD